MRIFRLHRRQRPASDYGGSLLYASRWNDAGIPLLYASSSLALACLETLVHLKPNQIPADYVCSSANLPSIPPVAGFRGDLRDESLTRRFGRSWANERRELAICVPSLIVPLEFNVMLNPTHTEFDSMIWNDPEPFNFDQRLLRIPDSPEL
jgi:RES domain-containing protein